MREWAEIQMTDADYEAVLNATPLKVPSKTGINGGARFYAHVKIGGKMQLTTVTCKSAPYIRKFRDGRTALYVDVYSYGVSASVNISKLRVIPEVGRG